MQYLKVIILKNILWQNRSFEKNVLQDFERECVFLSALQKLALYKLMNCDEEMASNFI